MEVTYGFLAQAANISADGRLNALGVFEQVMFPKFPVTFPHVAVIVCNHIRPSDAGQKIEIGLRLVTEDGKELLDMRLGMALPPPPVPPNLPPIFNVFDVNNIPLTAAGTYEFIVTVNGHQEKSMPLVVIQGKP